ncbi:MAG: lytic transglycosylase domain-containing protein [Synergistaceae bacterium]|jgi:soluble lytic murein transglycosylase-like protein|nr:lytic transglycosylase domain-containing protein [Synergistaceae bacterium]
MFSKFTDSTVNRIARMAFCFVLTALPFIILSLASVSNGFASGQESDAGYAAFMRQRDAAGESNCLLARPAPEKTALQYAQIGYDASVIRAVREMGLVLDHFDAWIEEHPGSSLARIRFMPPAMQRSVASTALFIRKTNPRIDAKTAWREATAFVHYSAKYGVPPALSTAVGKAESTFDPNALSPKGASGVMQVMWRIHKGLLNSNGIYAAAGANPLSDPEKAIAAGCLLLSRYIRAYGSIQLAMNRYSGGGSAAYLRKVNRNIASIMNHEAELAMAVGQ